MKTMGCVFYGLVALMSVDIILRACIDGNIWPIVALLSIGASIASVMAISRNSTKDERQ